MLGDTVYYTRENQEGNDRFVPIQEDEIEFPANLNNIATSSRLHVHVLTSLSGRLLPPEIASAAK